MISEDAKIKNEGRKIMRSRDIIFNENISKQNVFPIDI